MAMVGSGAVVHDAVVGAAGAGAVAGEHLRGGPAVQLHQVPFGSAAVQPGVAEVVPEPVRVGGHAALPADSSTLVNSGTSGTATLGARSRAVGSGSSFSA